MKLGILCTHPIQYYSPFFRELAKKTDLMVYYCFNPDKEVQGKGFGVKFKWNIPLLEGYEYEFLKYPQEISEKINKGDFDIFIVFGWYYKEARIALKVCNELNIPIYARGDSQLLMHTLWKRGLKQLFFRRFLSKFDGFLSVGQRFSDYLKFFGVSTRKIHFCPHCVDNDFFQVNRIKSLEEKGKLRKDYGINYEDILFLYCGKLVHKKRPLDFLKALARLRDPSIKGMLVGDGILRKRLENYARRNKLAVSFSGFINQSELPKIYSISDCLVLPSDARETWGLVVNESFACGTPAIVSNFCGSAPDLIENGKTGYFYKFADVNDLTTRMEQFIEAKKDGFDFEHYLTRKIETYSIETAVESLLKMK